MAIESERAKSIIFLVVAAAISLWLLYIVRGLLLPVFYGIVFAIALYPVYKRSLIVFKDKEALAGIASVLAGLIILAIAVTLVSGYLVRDAGTLIETAGSNVDELAPQVADFTQRFTAFLPDSIETKTSGVNFREQIINLVRNAGEAVVVSLQAWTRNVVSFVAMLLISLYSTFYFLVNGKRWLSHLKKIFPLPNDEEDYLADRFIGMVKASLRTVFVMGGIQGFLGGLIFGLLGVPAPFFWGLVFAIFSLIPGLGHPLVWLPAAIIFFITGEMGKGVILIAYGLVIMGMADDVLRPYLVGKKANIHPFLILLSTLGGLATFGFTGLILGPVVASLTVAIWELYEKRYS